MIHTPPSQKPRRRPALAAAALALSLAAAGCSGPSAGGDKKADGAASGGSASSSSSAAQPMPSTDPALARFTGQNVHWSSCEGDKECADITVPVDYAHPDKETMRIRAIRIPSSNPKAPALFVNPGGPGGSGYDLVKDDDGKFDSDAIRSRYSVVGFDPRGVSRSEGIQCLTDKEKDAKRAANIDDSTPEGLAKAHAAAKALGQKCKEKSGPVLAHMDTASAARDLDVMRAATQSPRLNYLGFSYGTYLGAMYAQLFPDNVGRFVLDGAVKPNATPQEIDEGQAVAFEKSFTAYAKSCAQRGDCPLKGEPKEQLAQLTELIAKYRKTPGKTSDGRVFTADDLVQALILPMYEDSIWPMLDKAIRGAMEGKPDTAMRIADLSLERDESGHYSGNQDVAFSGVQCLDHPGRPSDAEMKADAKQLEKKAPFTAPLISYSQLPCVEWPVTPAKGAPAIKPAKPVTALVIGTTGDPATPYEWSKDLASTLGGDSRVLTSVGHGHTAFGRAGSCVTDAVLDYLAEGRLPKAGKVCT